MLLIEKEKQVIQEKIDNAKSKLSETNTILEKIEAQIENYDMSLIDEGDSSILEVIDKIKTKQAEVNLVIRQKNQLLDLHSKADGKCPTCNNDLDSSCLPTDEEMTKLKDTIRKLEYLLQTKNGELQAYRESKDGLEKLKSNHEKVKIAIKTIEDTIENLNLDMEKPIDVIKPKS